MGSIPLDEQLRAIGAEILARFETSNVARDAALNDGRQVIRLAANSIRASHRGELDEAERLCTAAAGLLRKILESLRAQPAVYWAGYVQDAMKEAAEAAIVLGLVRGDPLPSPAGIGVEDAPYLNALAEAASELRRLILHTLRGEELDRAESLLQQMDAIYDLLVTIDYPDAITGGLRRTTDQLRAVLERTRGDVTITLNQRRLERALGTPPAGGDTSGLEDVSSLEA
jgi:translin